MSQVWASSMNGAPWTLSKMNEATNHLRQRAFVSYVIDVDKLEDLQELDQYVFAARPDLVLSISQIDVKMRYTDDLIEALANLKHIRALQLNLHQNMDLSKLGKLVHLQYLSIISKKPLNLSFLSSMKELQYLSLLGKYLDLTPIGEASRLDTLRLGTAIQDLGFVHSLPKLVCLFINDCTLDTSLAALADSSVHMLSLAGIRNLTKLHGLESVSQLTYLSLSLSKVEALCDFSGMPHLRQLELDYMPALKHIEQLWTAEQLEVLRLKEIPKAIKAEDLQPVVTLEQLRQLDFQFIDTHKGRINALREWVTQAGKAHILYENMADDQRIKPQALEHLRKHLGLDQ